MDYRGELDEDLPVALKRAIAKRTGIVGGVTVKEVTNVADQVAWLGFASPLWSISLSDEVAENLGIAMISEAFNGIAGVGFHVYDQQDWFNVTFACWFDEFCNPYGLLDLEESNEPFPHEKVSLPPHLRHMEATDYEDAWLDQKVNEVWPTHMKHVADAFLSLLDRLARIEVSLKAKWEVRVETEAERIARENCATAFYQGMERRRQGFLLSRPRAG